MALETRKARSVRAVSAKGLSRAQIAANFSDLHPPLDAHEARVESDRCYFCHDAPCMSACPTAIDIPLFIREINTGNPDGAARTIFMQNILGGMCARVCPTETLCEQVCVRNAAEGKPVKIGLLQRYATDHLMEQKKQPFSRAAKTGRRVAVIGAGPAGLACAHRLALHGHSVEIFEGRRKPGGLNEYGIAAYKATDDFARREAAYVLGVGGIKVHYSKLLGKNLKLEKLRKEFDAVFLGVGLQGVNALGLSGEGGPGVDDAVDYIAELRQASDLTKLKVGKRIAVVGGGMTAIDIAVQSKLLGAEEVMILYRRTQEKMGASVFEQELAKSKGVVIHHSVVPLKVKKRAGRMAALICETTTEKNGKVKGTGKTVEFACDTVFKAIGQTYVDPTGGVLRLEKGRILVDAERRTSLAGVWAGGDCVYGGKDLTVASVDDGRRAAESINAALAG